MCIQIPILLFRSINKLRVVTIIHYMFQHIIWQNKRIGENGPSLMRHIYKGFFSKIEELRNYVKKKNAHREQCHEFAKNYNRPILRDKIVLMILFIRSHFVIDRSCTTIKLHISRGWNQQILMLENGRFYHSMYLGIL